MMASDGDGDLVPRSIPELIKHLWDMYFAMARDPALEQSAQHLRQAAITLEETRRLAAEICQEEQRKTKRSPSRKPAARKPVSPMEWLENAKTASQLKH
jgi:hypothetical protein